MTTDFAALLRRLQAGEVRFALVGGLACALNGHVRATEDVDILIDAAPDNVARLLAALADWGVGSATTLRPEEFTLEPGAIRIMEDFPLDVFTTFYERTYADLAPHIRHTPDGLPYLDHHGLIFTKSRSWREKDRLDIGALRRLAAATAAGS